MKKSRSSDDSYSEEENSLSNRGVNPETTRDLIIRAKGPDRSIRSFAVEVGVSHTSISRFINGDVGKINVPLLERIANCADPVSGVTLEALMKAQGYSVPSLKEYIDDCRRIFMDSLISQGYMVKGLDPDEYRRVEGYKSELDFEITTNALKNGTGKWAVICGLTSGFNHVLPSGYPKTRIALDHAMACFYQQNRDIQRISLVVDRRVLFEQLSNHLKRLSIPNEISVVLINRDRGTITDEYVAPLNSSGYQDQVFGKSNS